MPRRNTYNGRLYKEDPTIFAWDILNEPRQTAGDYTPVQKWIDMMASFLKSVDPNHMVRCCLLRPCLRHLDYCTTPRLLICLT